MIKFMALNFALAASFLGCGTDNANECEEAVHHMGLGILPAGEASPEGGELAVIKSITAVSIKQCTSEGLSKAQAVCILAYQPFAKGTTVATAMTTLIECPAIAKKRPSWLRMPSTEQLSEMRQAETGMTTAPAAK